MTEAPRGSGCSALEDEPLIAMVLVDILEEAGCTVVGPAHDADQAAKLIAENAIDVAVLDVNLGSGRTSATIADSLKSVGTPFVFATGYGEQGLRMADPGQLRVVSA